MLKSVALFFYRLYTYVFFFPILPVSYLFFSLIGVLCSYIPVIGEKVTIYVLTYWAKFICILIPVRYEVEGIEKIKKAQSCVILANHTSLVDALVIYSFFGTKIRSVMKQELRNIPVFGYTCERMGIIAVDRSNSETAIASINKAKKKLKNGTSIFFFPEGTRSKNGILQPFKKGAFHIALDMNLPVLPITIIGASKICPNGTLKLKPGRVILKIHDVIESSKYSKDLIDNFVNEAHTRINSSLLK